MMLLGRVSGDKAKRAQQMGEPGVVLALLLQRPVQARPRTMVVERHQQAPKPGHRRADSVGQHQVVRGQPSERPQRNHAQRHDDGRVEQRDRRVEVIGAVGQLAVGRRCVPCRRRAGSGRSTIAYSADEEMAGPLRSARPPARQGLRDVAAPGRRVVGPLHWRRAASKALCATWPRFCYVRLALQLDVAALGQLGYQR